MEAFYKKLLDNNKEWVAKSLEKDPKFFSRLANGQQPPILWIGCSDSRVPANEIIGAQPGEVFVHRNIANMVLHTDMSMLSVLDYAVNVLKVKHVIVCGHYGCGGVQAALTNKHIGLIDNWIRHIKDVYRFHQELSKPFINKTVAHREKVVINASKYGSAALILVFRAYPMAHPKPIATEIPITCRKLRSGHTAHSKCWKYP